MHETIDLDRYPIDTPETGGYATLRADCIDQLERQGAVVLDGFMREPALVPAMTELAPHLSEAFYKPKSHSPYLIADDAAFPPDHPRNAKQYTSSATLAYDRIPATSALNRLYLWEPFRAFLADILGFDALYPYADTLTPLNVLIYDHGTSLGWHFDVPPFVVTLTLQQSESGGVFLFAPFIRTDEDENYEAVADVLRDRSDAVRELKQPPGALVIFRGNRTIHRVTEITGKRPRLTAAFSYSRQPGTISDAHNRQTFYGRLA